MPVPFSFSLHLRAGLCVGVLALATSGCTIQAPPAEDIRGDGLTVSEGRLSVDAEKVPVLESCADGQIVRHVTGGWDCIAAPTNDSPLTAGAGIVIAADQVSANFGDSAGQVARGNDLAAARVQVDALTNAIAANDAAGGSIAVRGSLNVDGGTSTGPVSFRAQKLCVHSLGATVVSSGWDRERCEEFATAIGASGDVRLGCLKDDDFNIGVDGGVPSGDDACGW